MRTRLRRFLLCFAAAALTTAASDSNRLVVHEWGTFLAMSGSDGIALDGMYHEEHALPSFVHARSRDQLRLPTSRIKGETPVIYFYTARPRRARVDVGFPTGLWTQWYPQATFVSPGLAKTGTAPLTRNGRIGWDLDIVPADSPHGALPATPSDALWNHARQVDSAYVRTASSPQPGVPAEWERFLFYRGLGEAPLPVSARASADRVTATTSEVTGLRHLFILRVEGRRGAFSYISELAAGSVLEQRLPSMTDALPLETFASRLSDAMARRLVESGLYEKEARAMVNTWRASYFQTEGVRLLFVLPQAWTDRFIPIAITPEPTALIRVMVGRLELLDPAREQRAEDAIRNLTSNDRVVRERAFALLRAEGRFIEPIVRRTLRTTTDASVRMLGQRLLSTDFVTRISAGQADSTGEPGPQTDRLASQAASSSP